MSTYYRPHDSEFFSKRLLVLVAIIAFHALIVWAFMSGLATNTARILQTILKTNIIETEKVQELPPPPPQVKLNAPPPVTVVAPDVVINIPPPPPPVTIAPKPVAAKPISAPPAPVIAAKVTYTPDTSDYYPPQSQRNNEEGRAMVRVCVDERGRVASVTLDSSTGHALLDDAALRVAKQARFKAATQAGKPVQWCGAMPVKFTLKAGM